MGAGRGPSGAGRAVELNAPPAPLIPYRMRTGLRVLEVHVHVRYMLECTLTCMYRCVHCYYGCSTCTTYMLVVPSTYRTSVHPVQLHSGPVQYMTTAAGRPLSDSRDS